MLEKAGIPIAIIFILALIAAGAMTCNFVNYSVIPPREIEITSEVEPPPPPGDWIPLITNPRAILVLDVSGSMGITSTPSDPDRLQAVAALQFYDTYLKISREVLDGKNKAGVAVVLFGTVAQTIDWEGRGGDFLEVTEGNQGLFQDVVFHYLGTPKTWEGGTKDDPRRSQDTDYATALDALNRLVANADSPPAVIFMTDGKLDPHACFTPLLDQAARSRLATCSGRGRAPEKLSANSRPLIFNRRSGDNPLSKVHLPDTIDPTTGVTQRVRRLLARRFPVPMHGTAQSGSTAPLAWFPIFLDINASSEDLAQVSTMLDCDASSRRYWELPEGIIHCRTAGDMVRQYVAVLARWFRMVELPLAPGETRFQIPANTQAIALQVESDSPLTSLTLVKDGRETELTGRGRFWGGVVADNCAGQWTFKTGGAGRLISSIYVRPRYDWVLSAPKVCSYTAPTDADEDEPRKAQEAHLYLCRISDATEVEGSGVYPNLPERLPGQIRFANGDRFPIAFSHGSGGESDKRQPTYMAAIPVEGAFEGPARLTIDLRSLRERNIPLREVELTFDLEIAPHNRLIVLDYRGQRSDQIKLDKIPRAPGWAWTLRELFP